MNNLKSFKRFVVVEKESGRPMSFQDDQFCFCTTSDWKDWHHPLKSYSYANAIKLIEKSMAFRKRKKFHLTEYLLMPISSR